MIILPSSLDAATSRVVNLLFDSPQLCLHEFDLHTNQAIFIRMDRAGYAASSFLDSRAVRAGDQLTALPLGGLLQLLPKLGLPRRRVDFLFHIGHCGSTLLSRVLAEFDDVLPLREPPPLLDLAQMLRFFGTPRMTLSMEQWQQLFGLAMYLQARSYGADERVMIKPMSHANNLLPHLLAWHPHNRAALIHVDLPTCLATMLKPFNRPETRRALHESRARDFERLTGDPGLRMDLLTDAQAAAMVWLLQMSEFHQAVRAAGMRARLLPVHFDDFLRQPQEWLRRLTDFFGLAADASKIDAVLQGEVMSSYSKLPGAAYHRNRRGEELRHARTQYAGEIENALNWASEIVDRYPVLQLPQDALAADSRLALPAR